MKSDIIDKILAENTDKGFTTTGPIDIFKKLGILESYEKNIIADEYSDGIHYSSEFDIDCVLNINNIEYKVMLWGTTVDEVQCGETISIISWNIDGYSVQESDSECL